MIKLSNVRIPINYNEETLRQEAARKLHTRESVISRAELFRLSLDARDKGDIHYTATLIVEIENENSFLRHRDAEKYSPYVYPQPAVSRLERRPVVAGSGPAGLFAALILAQAGARPILIERGLDVDSRIKAVETFQRGGPLDPECNVQFGEGGAGTFSDGKLTTGTRDPRLRKVTEEFIAAGAPEEIAYLARPHIGTDKLVGVVKNLRKKITALGGEVRFGCRLTDLVVEKGRLRGVVTGLGAFEADRLVLATGHSARDVFELCAKRGLFMEPKPFSVGVRIEHPQELIQRMQYGGAEGLPPADYKAAVHLRDGRGVYTFCMCPGGEVIASASEPETVVTNGMSRYARGGRNANSALLVSVGPDDFPGGDIFAGVRLQRKLERQAFYMGGGNYKAPAALVADFLKGQKTAALGAVEPSYPIGVTLSNLRGLFPEFISNALAQGIELIDRKLRGFAMADAVLTGVESRSSSPLRICRGEDFQSSVKGVYPCGEGAGYAGGIMSAAVDGIRCAEAALK